MRRALRNGSLAKALTTALLLLAGTSFAEADGVRWFAENVYGVRSGTNGFASASKQVATAETAVDGVPATRREFTVATVTPLGRKEFRTVLYQPKKAGLVPCFVYIAFDPSDRVDNPRWPIGRIVGRGYATACFCYEDVLADEANAFDSIKRASNGWGAISTWAFAAGEVAECLKGVAGIDASKLAVVGHSRLGKTALWTTVTDSRFACACVNDSGCFGARLHAFRLPESEDVEFITRTFPHWFAPRCRAYAGKDTSLPFDQNVLLAAVAPRLLAVGSADGDDWACPSAEFASWSLAKSAWKNAEATDYHVRHGGHALTAEDWDRYMDFTARNGW